MKSVCKSWLGLAALLAAGVALTGQAQAQAYPTQTVKIVIPFSAGSATDTLARILGDELSKKWGQSVIVENRPGLPGTTGVAKSAPDGYTIMLTSNGHTMAGVVNKNLQFDPVKDFVGITPVATIPLVLIVPPDSPAKNLQDLIAMAKAKPGTLNFSSPGLASSTFIAGALFKQAAGVDIVHVPYKGAPEAVTAVVRGDAQMYFTPVNVGTELVKAGKVKAIAVVTPQRLPSLKDVPTMKESGMPNFSYDSWFGLMAPAGTPAAIVAKINKDTIDVLKMPEIQAKLAAQGVVPFTTTPEVFNKMIADDTTKLMTMFKDGVK